MARLIDADALIYQLTEVIRHSTGEYKHGLQAARLLTVEAPTAAKDINVPDNGWISVKDRLPEMAGQRFLLTVRNVHFGNVLVIIGHTGYGVAPWYTSDQLYMEDFRAGNNRLSHNYIVTHWQALPEPPKEDETDE